MQVNGTAYMRVSVMSAIHISTSSSLNTTPACAFTSSNRETATAPHWYTAGQAQSRKLCIKSTLGFSSLLFHCSAPFLHSLHSCLQTQQDS